MLRKQARDTSRGEGLSAPHAGAPAHRTGEWIEDRGQKADDGGRGDSRWSIVVSE